MGSFNEIIIQCPKCCKEIEIQSKGGTCDFERLPIEEASLGDLDEIVTFSEPRCEDCNISIKIIVQTVVTVRERHKPKDNEDEFE